MGVRRIPDNQGKCCDAALRLLEDRLSASRKYIRRDTEGGDVEVVCQVGLDKFALEHTRVDPYPKRVQADIDAQDFMEPVVAALNQKGGSQTQDAITLVFPVGAFAKQKRRDYEKAQRAIVDWVRSAAPLLPEPAPGRVTQTSASPPETPFPLTLQRSARFGKETFSYARFAPPNLEGLRQQRIRKALEDKLPKLATYKRDGYKTVLVLEDDDLAISNHSLIGEAVHHALKEIKLPSPDMIILVETTHPSMWIACILKDGDFIWPSEEPIVVPYEEFDPAILVDVLSVELPRN